MNVEIGTEAEQFLFWEYLFHIFVIVSLQCDPGSESPSIYTSGGSKHDPDRSIRWAKQENGHSISFVYVN
jgi:hypothetical protein